MFSLGYKSFNNLVPSPLTDPDPVLCFPARQPVPSERLIHSCADDRDSFVQLLQALESVHQPLPESVTPTLADRLLPAFDEDWFGLRHQVVSVIGALCQRSPSLVNALLDRGAVRDFAVLLRTETDAGILLNLLKILSSCQTLLRGFEICLETDVFWSRCFNFFDSWPRSLLPEIANRYRIALEKRAWPLYAPLSKWVSAYFPPFHST
jgi:hypothetical protein